MEKFVEVVNKRGRIIDWVDYNKAIKLTTDDPGPRTALKEDELSNKHLRITRLNNGKFVLISSKDPLGNDSKAIILTKKETVSALQLWNATDEAQKNYKQFVHNYYKTRKIKSLIIILLIISVFPASYFTGIFIQNDDQPASISTTGNDAKLYLQSDQFDNILIEIDYVNGREPNNGSLDELVTFFKKTCDKDRIWYEWSDIIIPENDNANTTYSSDDLRDIEERYRDNYKLGSTIVIYIIYLNGNLSTEKDDVRILGRTFSSSSFALSIDGMVYRAESWEFYTKVNITLHHEAGHLLGLVNKGYESDVLHEDTENPRHCKMEDCTMSKGKDYGLQYQFCEYCMDDLEKLKSNIY